LEEKAGKEKEWGKIKKGGWGRSVSPLGARSAMIGPLGPVRLTCVKGGARARAQFFPRRD